MLCDYSRLFMPQTHKIPRSQMITIHHWPPIGSAVHHRDHFCYHHCAGDGLIHVAQRLPGSGSDSAVLCTPPTAGSPLTSMQGLVVQCTTMDITCTAVLCVDVISSAHPLCTVGPCGDWWEVLSSGQRIKVVTLTSSQATSTLKHQSPATLTTSVHILGKKLKKKKSPTNDKKQVDNNHHLQFFQQLFQPNTW